MKLVFEGHEETYAIEQSLLNLFPAERPVYEGEEEKNRAVVSLKYTENGAVARSRILYEGREEAAECRASFRDCADDAYKKTHEIQKALKLSFYRAAVKLLGAAPPWGALTGVRPAKLVTRLLGEGKTAKEVNRVLADTYEVSASRRRLAIEAAEVSRRLAADIEDRDYSLYLGIPFCPTRCVYCSFVAESVEKSFALVEPYLKMLHKEIDLSAAVVKDMGLRLRSFYMGGGTPTTLSAGQMDELLAHLREAFRFPEGLELTVEAGRPDTMTREKLEVLKRNGVNRVSVNPQTMETHVLRAIGREHSPEDIVRAMDMVHAVGFRHINMDLIAGLPADSPAGFRRTLQEVLLLDADNITVHTLALKKGSRLLSEGAALPTAEEVGEMLAYSGGVLRKADYAPYYLYRQKYMSGSFENVGWCREGAENLYNVYIMEELMTILSLGAGGSTKMVCPANGNIQRVFNCKYPREYITREEKFSENLAIFRGFYETNFPHIF